MGFVYLGSIAADLPAIIRGDVGPGRAWQIVIIVASTLFTLAALGLLTFYAKRELQQQMQEKRAEEGRPLAGGPASSHAAEVGPN